MEDVDVSLELILDGSIHQGPQCHRKMHKQAAYGHNMFTPGVVGKVHIQNLNNDMNSLFIFE